MLGGVYHVGRHHRWAVNHYRSHQAVLGWLVLQPVECVPTLQELSNASLEELGPIIKQIQRAMTKIWPDILSNDRLERIHTTSFMESEFDKNTSPNKQSEYYHVHMFLIPRSKILGRLIRREVWKVEQYVPWDDWKIAQRIRKQNDKNLIAKVDSWAELRQYIEPVDDTATACWWKTRVEEFMRKLWNELSVIY